MQRRWWILALLVAARTTLGFQFQAVASVQPLLTEAFGVGFAETGTLIGLYMLPGVLLALPSGALGRWLGDRALACLGFALMAAGGVLGGLAEDYAVATIGRVLAGVGAVVNIVYLAKMATDWFAGREIIIAMSLLVTSWPGGIALGQLVQAPIALAAGWPLVFHATAAASLAALVAVALGYVAPPAVAAAGGNAARLNGRELAAISFAALVWTALNAGYVIYLGYAPVRLVETGMSLAEGNAVASLGSWVMLASIPLVGALTQRLNRPNLVIVAGCLVGWAALAALPYAAWPVLPCLLVGLMAAAPAGVIMALPAEVLRPETRAIGMGIFYTWYYLGMLLAPAAAGMALDLTGNAAAPLMVGGGFMGSGVAFLAGFRLMQRRVRQAMMAAG